MVRRSGIRVNGSGWEEREQEKVTVGGGGEGTGVQRWSEMVKQRKRRERWCIARRQPAVSGRGQEGIGSEGLIEI
jgi:hypothetical protein